MQWHDFWMGSSRPCCSNLSFAAAAMDETPMGTDAASLPCVFDLCSLRDSRSPRRGAFLGDKCLALPIPGDPSAP